jgi:hypothetical protein
MASAVDAGAVDVRAGAEGHGVVAHLVPARVRLDAARLGDHVGVEEDEQPAVGV